MDSKKKNIEKCNLIQMTRSRNREQGLRTCG